jgi:hypothetical protein
MREDILVRFGSECTPFKNKEESKEFRKMGRQEARCLSTLFNGRVKKESIIKVFIQFLEKEDQGNIKKYEICIRKSVEKGLFTKFVKMMKSITNWTVFIKKKLILCHLDTIMSGQGN